jgi:hypothetical protein
MTVVLWSNGEGTTKEWCTETVVVEHSTQPTNSGLLYPLRSERLHHALVNNSLSALFMTTVRISSRITKRTPPDARLRASRMRQTLNIRIGNCARRSGTTLERH